MNHPVLMGAHENRRTQKSVWTGQGIVIAHFNQLHLLKFAPHFKSWPKLVRRLENYGFSCDVKLIGKTVTVITTAELQAIQALIGNRRSLKKSKYRLILVTPVFVVLGALVLTLQPHNYSTQSKTELINNDECGIEYLTKAIASDVRNPKLLDQTSSRMGGIESGTFFCDDSRFSYTLELQEPKRVLSLLELDS